MSAGVVIPFWSNNNTLFLAGKGDGNIWYYEYESDNLYALDEHQSSDPQRGMCFVPRRAVNTSECEIAHAYKLTTSVIEPISFIVPRKSDSFQSDIFPPAQSIEPSLSAGEFFSGKPISLRFVSLETGALSTSMPASAPMQPTRSATASAPQSAHSAYAPPSLVSPAIVAPPLNKVPNEPTPVSSSFTSTSASASVSTSASAYAPTPISPADVQIPPSRSASTYVSDDGKAAAAAVLHDDNERLSAELRDAQAKIRHLEL